jgi:hypothetical protein
MWIVVFEDAYKTKILFKGTHGECKVFMKLNVEPGDDCVFMQELETV